MISFVVYIYLSILWAWAFQHSSIPAYDYEKLAWTSVSDVMISGDHCTAAAPLSTVCQHASRESSGAGSHCSINLITFHFYSDPTTTALAALLSLSWQTYLIIWPQIFRNNGKGTTNQQYQQTSLSLILFVGNIWYLHNFGKQFLSIYIADTI